MDIEQIREIKEIRENFIKKYKNCQEDLKKIPFLWVDVDTEKNTTYSPEIFKKNIKKISQ